MKAYHDAIQRILDEGVDRSDRTGTGTRSVFGHQMRFDLSEGFPLLTTKSVHFKSVVHELLWFLAGDTNVAYLQQHGVRIWNEWADEHGDLGPVYGKQWRSWEVLDTFTDGSGSTFVKTYDQIEQAIHMIRHNPDSRRIVVSAWNVADLEKMALAPCHCLFQFYVANGKLSCQLYQRSADIFLGVPFNIASYALLTHMMAQVCGLEVGDYVHSFGDMHLYHNHFEQARLLLSREEREAPKLKIKNRGQAIDGFVYEDFELIGYHPHPPIKAEVAV